MSHTADGGARETDGMILKALDAYEDRVLSEVRDGDGYFVLIADGGHLCVDKSRFKSPPRAGQTARYYGGGSLVRGVDIDGVEIYYESERAYNARTHAEQAVRDAKSKADADADRPARDARVAALPECFQKRIARFRRNNPDFYWNHEGYEMAACVDAVKIADALGTADAVREFGKASWEEQKRRVPDLDDGHSGNTFGFALRLACHYLSDPRLVFAEHAAISPLLGCKDAGCLPVTDEEMRAESYEPFRKEPDA